jgi:hypothetical protein
LQYNVSRWPRELPYVIESPKVPSDNKMLALLLFASNCGSQTLHEVDSLPTKGEPVAVIAKTAGGGFIVVPKLPEYALFVGMDDGLGLRFDLVSNGLASRRLSDGRVMWRARASAAVYRSGNLVCLSNNALTTYSTRGKVISKQALARSNLSWDYLDPQLNYALGFRSKPDSPDTWSLFALDIKSGQAQRLPITYDLGGHVSPQIYTAASAGLIFDLFYTHTFHKGRPASPNWGEPKTREKYHVVEAGVFDGELLAIESRSGSDEVRIVNVAEGQILWRGREPVRFVKQRQDRMYLWSVEDDRVKIFRLAR